MGEEPRGTKGTAVPPRADVAKQKRKDRGGAKLIGANARLEVGEGDTWGRRRPRGCRGGRRLPPIPSASPFPPPRGCEDAQPAPCPSSPPGASRSAAQETKGIRASSLRSPFHCSFAPRVFPPSPPLLLSSVLVLFVQFLAQLCLPLGGTSSPSHWASSSACPNPFHAGEGGPSSAGAEPPQPAAPPQPPWPHHRPKPPAPPLPQHPLPLFHPLPRQHLLCHLPLHFLSFLHRRRPLQLLLHLSPPPLRCDPLPHLHHRLPLGRRPLQLLPRCPPRRPSASSPRILLPRPLRWLRSSCSRTPVWSAACNPPPLGPLPAPLPFDLAPSPRSAGVASEGTSYEQTPTAGGIKQGNLEVRGGRDGCFEERLVRKLTEAKGRRRWRGGAFSGCRGWRGLSAAGSGGGKGVPRDAVERKGGVTEGSMIICSLCRNVASCCLASLTLGQRVWIDDRQER